MHRFRYDGTGPARSYTAGWPSSRIVSIGKGGGDDAASLERPTFVAQAITAFRLPYLVTSTILALLATGPGYFLARLIETGGDWNQTVVAIYGDAFALPLWRLTPLIILSVGFNLYLLWLVRHSRLHIARYANEIAPLLPDGKAGVRRIFGHLYSRLPVIGLAAAFGLFFSLLLLEPMPPGFGFLEFLILGLNLLFLPFVDAQVIWNYVATIWGVHRVGREALRLRPAVEDPMLGLRPLGSLSLGATFYYFGALAIIIAEVTLSPDPVPADVAVRDASDDSHCRDHLDRRGRRPGARHRRLFPVMIASLGDDPKFKAPTLVCGPGIGDALRRMRDDEQRDLPLLPVLRGLLDRGGHGGGARNSGDSRSGRASAAPRRSPPAGVRPAAADARLRRPLWGRVLLPRPGHRLLPERQFAHGAPALVGSDPGRPSRLPAS